MMAGRYGHAKQLKRHQRQLPLPLSRASQIRSQQQRQRGFKL
ncbi:transposase, IS5 family, partial [Bradyrhizobium yuanmingense]